MKNDLIAEIKKKKELRGIADFIVKEALSNYLRKHKIPQLTLNEQDKKLIIKEIRAELRNLVGRFQKSQKAKAKLLESNNITELLKTHSSTAERITSYPELKKIIKQLSPNSILDIGCGLNPIALAEKDTKYFASDINKEDLEIVRQYFRKNKITGKVFIYDIRSSPKKLPKADLCLILKVLDIIKNKIHLAKLLKEIPCQRILISFSTKKLSGKPMSSPRRMWFERELSKLKFPFKKFASENEDFYLIEKSTTE